MTPSLGSLRTRLLVGVLIPVLLYAVLNTVTLYRQALVAADTAYDRTLLASAKSIGELLEVATDGGRPRLRSTLVYSALEAFEADNRSRLFYKVTGFDGELVSGFGDLGPARPAGRDATVYAALVHFYDDTYRGDKVRMAVLLQPVSGAAGQGMATVQVAETLELRRTLAQALLWQTLWQQALLVASMTLAVFVVVQRATEPVRALSLRLRQRAGADLEPLPMGGAPLELRPVIEAMNAVLARMAQLLEHQKRFVRDASHQLRTPLAVLKTQVQSARRGDLDATLALSEIEVTVERATALANQMLALAKVEQLRQQGDAPVCDWSDIVRDVALEIAPLIASASLELDIDTAPASVRGHGWALKELTRNLVHNAVRHTPACSRLQVKVEARHGHAILTVADSGPGIDDEQRQRLFQPFVSSAPDASGHSGSGLGLAICREIVHTLGGTIELVNRHQGGCMRGLDAIVRLPLLPA